ncbi:hypothetical protein MSI_09110 [Treponema sp. JC4]|uniref:hypothetical protein n=1 Tax=Treponema sp. JC4 TaxID=1124982 RepID=UPI00025AFBB7|nr:hypothetical protein [Treponema sp. JC4]EID85656.1 hypothetical protein MSI_09110 [Treponema sp. JC4]
MKKNVKSILTGLVAAALLAGLSSCSNGSGVEENFGSDIYSGELITFKATQNSVNDSDVNLIIQYNRSKPGANEQISLGNTELEVKLNGNSISMPSRISFELDPYSSFDDSYSYQSAETPSNQKQYKVKLPINNAITSGDTLTVELKAAQIAGEGADIVDMSSIVVGLIDCAPTAGENGYYNELSANAFKSSLVTQKNGKGLNESDDGETVTYKTFTVPVNKTISDASIVGLLLQTDNDGSQDADGLKIEIKDFEMSVKVGDADAITVKEDSIILEPNQYASPAYAKTDKRFRLGLTGEIAQGTNIVLQVKKATITNEAKKDAIIFALQEDGESYAFLADGEYLWKNPFETVEE